MLRFPRLCKLQLLVGIPTLTQTQIWVPGGQELADHRRLRSGETLLCGPRKSSLAGSELG